MPCHVSLPCIRAVWGALAKAQPPNKQLRLLCLASLSATSTVFDLCPVCLHSCSELLGVRSLAGTLSVGTLSSHQPAPWYAGGGVAVVASPARTCTAGLAMLTVLKAPTWPWRPRQVRSRREVLLGRRCAGSNQPRACRGKRSTWLHTCTACKQQNCATPSQCTRTSWCSMPGLIAVAISRGTPVALQGGQMREMSLREKYAAV